MGFLEDPILFLAEWLRGVFLGWGVSDLWSGVILQLIGAVVVGMGIMLVFIALTWVERKGAARFQDRIGPNRVGPWGIAQPFADALKMLTKEDTTPEGADKFTYNLAPVLSTFAVLLAWGVMPFTPNWVGADLDVGVLFIAAVGSFGVLAVMLAGWSSNNKYSLIGAFRGVAQLIAYEVPLFLALLVPVFLARTMGINSIVQAQVEDGIWYFFMVPMVWVIYYIASLAEVGRAPFDLLEAESELVAGYQVEYSGMKFGLFQVGEFLHSWTFAALNASIFFGGYSFFGLEKYWAVAFLVFFAKTFFFYMVVIWTRMTFPRVRIDQMMNLNWKVLVPTSLVLLMGIPLIEYFVRVNTLGTFPRWALLFGFNVIVGVIFFTLATRANNKDQRERVRFEPRPVAVMPVIETAPEIGEEEAAA
ncbi:MAG TPA: NADH-quinone oxidoreductase subunit NuoH [Anaerolineales bacterium]|nr:NADH-quinone oxidoreductase subunit NuoH [Anaerolineales bacterium]